MRQGSITQVQVYLPKLQCCCMQVLLSSVVQCWDKLRESSISVLMSLETPLPGIDTPAALKDLVTWAQRLVSSPRVRESDAGAQDFADTGQPVLKKHCHDISAI